MQEKLFIQTSGRVTRPNAMDQLAIPNHPELLEALGHLAVAHTHLELILRYTVKTLAGLSVKEALDATHRARTSDVRSRIRKLFERKNLSNQKRLI